MTLSVTFILQYSCKFLSNKIILFVTSSDKYISKAKYQLLYAHNVTDSILFEYQKMVNLQEMVQQSAMKQVSEIYIDNDKEFHFEFRKRRLLENNFNPELEIAKGKGYLDVLNQTIINTEININNYIEYGKHYEEMCYDFSGLHDNFYYIFISFVLLTISGYFIFANHYKYFSVYNYIIHLVKKNDIEL